MRTTLNLDDEIAAAAKRRAAETGATFTSLVEEGLRLLLMPSPPATKLPALPRAGRPDGRHVSVEEMKAALDDIGR